VKRGERARSRGGGAGGAEAGLGVAAVEVLVIRLAEEPVVAQRELVPGDQVPLARRAPKAVDVVNLRFGSHYKVILLERLPTLVALGPEKSANTKSNKPFSYLLIHK